MDEDLNLLTRRLNELTPVELNEALDVACARGRREARVAFLERGDDLLEQNEESEYFELIIGPAFDENFIDADLTEHWRNLMNENELNQDPRVTRFLECWHEQRTFERESELRRNQTITNIEEQVD